MKKWIEINEVENGFWIMLCGKGSDGLTLKHYCAEKLEPFAKIEDAIKAAKFIASHFLNEDGSQLKIIKDGKEIE